MHDDRLLSVLCCPVTRQAVRALTEEELAGWNTLVQNGKVVDGNGDPCTELLKAALITEDGTRVYPVVNGTPVMLAEEALRRI
jgi:uncharacterized protein YbaR (Trm112 family)